jgi:hypothetical protein
MAAALACLRAASWAVDNRAMTPTAWFLVVGLVLGHLLIALCAPIFIRPGPDGEWLLAVMLGWCMAQVNLIGVWAALTPGRLLLRLLWSTFLATLIWYALVLGNQLRWWNFQLAVSFQQNFGRDDALLLGLVLLAGVILAQIPLWAASSLLRWRLLPPAHAQESQEENRRFGVSHLLIATVVVSVALGLGRLVLPGGPWRIARLDGELLVLLPVVAIVNLIVVLPCVWGAFVRKELLGGLTVGWLVYAVVVSLCETFILILFLGGGQDDIWMIMIVFNLSQCLCVFGTLLCLRGIGFRLRQFDRFGRPQLPLATHEGIDVVR